MNQSRNNPSSHAQAQKPLILLVEDGPSERLILKLVLEFNGYRCLAVRNSQEAQQALAIHRPDLVLLDMRLCETDAFSTCRYLQSSPQTRNIPFIFLASDGFQSTRQRSQAWGAVALLVKPYGLARLMRSIHAALN